LTAALADVTRAGAVAALVDADGVFDPASASQAGIDLRRLLWVRCAGRRDDALHATDLLVRCPGFRLIALDLGEIIPRLSLTAAFRLRLAVRRRGVAMLIVGRRRLTGPSASLAVETTQVAPEWTGPARTPTRLAGLETAMHVVRRRPGARVTIPDRASRRWSA
jgi:hypothetical protein